MIKQALFLILFLTAAQSYAQKIRKAVFIIADGIPLDVIQAHPMPNLKRLIKNGGLVPAYVGGEKGGYSETPTISSPGYNSLLTGTWAHKHNVWDNDITAPNYQYWNVFRFFKTAYPNKKTAVFSTWLDNRTKLIGSAAEAAGNLQPDFVFDGYELDTLQFPHDKDGHFYNKIDNYVIEKACSTIKQNAPDLSWIYLEYTDEMGHRHGDSPAFLNAVTQLDNQMGQLWKAIQDREKNHNEEWLIIITTDHGRDINGFHHGSQSNRERNTWMATNYGNMNAYFKKQQPAIVDIIPTILRFLQVEVPAQRLFELDGVPMIGEVSAINPTARLKNDTLTVQWIPINKQGKAKIWLSTSNEFKTTGNEFYTLLREVAVKDWQAQIDVANLKSNFYKIVIEMPNNTLNRWVITKE